MAWRAPLVAGVVTTTLLLATATVAIPPVDDSSYPECQPGVLRPFSSEKNGRDCARDAGFRSAFDLIRAPPSDAQLLSICKSRACDTLFNKRLPAQTPGSECIVPVGEKIRLYADLVSHVHKRCIDMKDAYVLLDCDVLGTNGGERSEFWYFPDAANVSFVPEKFNRYTISGNAKAAWEGDEVSVVRKEWEIFAYIDDTGLSEPEGHHAGILEAGRGGGLNNAYECSRADDQVYLQSGVSRCQRRYICYSE